MRRVPSSRSYGHSRDCWRRLLDRAQDGAQPLDLGGQMSCCASSIAYMTADCPRLLPAGLIAAHREEPQGSRSVVGTRRRGRLIPFELRHLVSTVPARSARRRRSLQQRQHRIIRAARHPLSASVSHAGRSPAGHAEERSRSSYRHSPSSSFLSGSHDSRRPLNHSALEKPSAWPLLQRRLACLNIAERRRLFRRELHLAPTRTALRPSCASPCQRPLARRITLIPSEHGDDAGDASGRWPWSYPNARSETAARSPS